MNDLVSYREKQNAENEEDNRDGENHNLSDGYGAEGPTRSLISLVQDALERFHFFQAASGPHGNAG